MKNALEDSTPSLDSLTLSWTNARNNRIASDSKKKVYKNHKSAQSGPRGGHRGARGALKTF